MTKRIDKQGLMPIHVGVDRSVLVLTGAGVSAESGVPTFRDANGLWGQFKIEKVASPDGFEEDPDLVWRFYSERRQGAHTCHPNPGHWALAAFEKQLGNRFLLVTQNVDGLHQKAGNQRVIALHGDLFTTRCSGCDRKPFHDTSLYLDGAPPCDRCASRGKKAFLRPHIVWFGEMLEASHLQRIEAFIAQAGKSLLFIAAGTSGAVYPASGLVDRAKRSGAETWLVNAEAAENTSSFDNFVRGKSGEILPRLFGQQ